MHHIRRAAQKVGVICPITADLSTMVADYWFWQNLTRVPRKTTAVRGLATAAEPYDVVVIGGGAFTRYIR